MKIAYCGRIGSFSHEASDAIFPNCEYLGFDSFQDAVNASVRNEVDYAILPIENSTAGRVAEIHNILPKVNLFFWKEYILRVSHNFYVLNNEVKIDDIKEIHSHHQALMQCSEFLEKINAVQVSEPNTAIAAEKLSVSKRSDVGVICSSIAGKHYGLHLLAENIQNNDENFTTFIAMCKNENLNKEANLTSVLFIIEDKVGGIYEALGCFARNNVNLIKVESYIPSVNSSYAQFFLTLSGNLQSQNIKKAMAELGKVVINIKIFGSYNADLKREL